jgi:hypothetical protein
MEARFTQLDALIISMATQMKSIAFGSGKAKDREDGRSYGLDDNPRFYFGTNFLISMARDETMPHMSKDHES